MYKILIAEDIEVIRNTLLHTVDWESMNISVCGAAENGKQALEIAVSEMPDILLTDIKMPVMDGIELIKEARSVCPQLKSIILTAYGDFNYAKSAIQLDVVDFILKPLDLEELEAVVRKTVALVEERRRELRESRLAREMIGMKFPLLAEHEDFEKTGGSIKNKKIVETAMNYIRRNVYSSVSVEEVANEVKLNAKYLNTIFKQVTGESISKYIITCRLEEAAKLLMDPSLRVYEVCDKLGYSDHNYFRTIFTKHFGVCPSEYRDKVL